MSIIGHWEIPDYIDGESFDLDWLPDPYDPPYIHQFGTTQDKGNGPRFVVDGSTDVKYHDLPLAKHKNESGSWEVPDSIHAVDFDFDWQPGIYEPLFIHQWPATTGKDHGPRLVIPGAAEVKYHDSPVFKHKNESGSWQIDKSIHTEDFDLSWVPDVHEPLFIHQWPATTGKDHGPRLVIPGATEVKYHESPIFKHKNESGIWEVPDSIHAGDFDFTWQPDIYEPLLIHHWPATTGKDHGPRLVIPGARRIKYHESPIFKHKNESGVWMIPDEIFTDDFDFTWQPDIYEPLLIHQWPATTGKDHGPRLVIPGATEVKYHESPVSKHKNESGVWEIPDSIFTGDFDFTWQPDIYEPLLIHQWPATTGKDHGPRLVIPGATEVKYHESPIFKHKNESGVWNIPTGLAVNGFDFDWHPTIYEPLLIHQWASVDGIDLGPCLMIPDATEVKYHDSPVFKYEPLDIVFVSNGETGEQRRYDRLCQVAGRTVEWVRGIDGRENALRRAAEISKTEWFFCFPAKLSVDYNFDFNFQPNRSYEPKHYIFYAQNPLNGLVYGHQAAVCYNRQHIVETVDYGLDFTMSKPHDIVPVVSGIAEYNSDPIMTWRTAFREAIKLKADGSDESLERLNTWLTYAQGQYCEWSIIGAIDGVEFYNSVNGDHRKLMKTFSWAWLNTHYEGKHGLYK